MSTYPEMVPLSADLEHYHKVYAAADVSSEEKIESYKKWADDVFTSQVTKEFEVCYHDLEALNILGIGSGCGDIDICLLKILVTKFPRINNDVFEPSAKMISVFKNSFNAKQSDMPGVKINYNQSTIQEFRAGIKRREAEGESVKRYHFIHVIHSIYYTGNAMRETILDLHSMLEENGVLLIITATRDHTLRRMTRAFPFIERSNTMKHFSSSEINQVLRELKIPFTSSVQESRSDLTSCFEAESEMGNFALDYVTQTVHFRVTAPAELREKVVAYLRSVCISQEGGCRGERKKYFGNRDWEAVLCRTISTITIS